MSWLEKQTTGLTITTGDGRKFTPLWMPRSRGKEYNGTPYEYEGIPGTLMDRKLPKGMRYEVEFLFQGDDHLDEADAFWRSADDPRAWTVTHPQYGSLLVQPLGLVQDNRDSNVSRFTGTLVETITEAGPRSTVAPADQVSADKEVADETLAQNYADEVPAPRVADQQNMRRNTLRIYTEGARNLRDSLDAEGYRNAFNTANSFIDSATSDPLAAMRQIQNLITAPARFADTVRNRINTLVNQFNILRSFVDAVLTKSDKKLYENNAGSIITTLALASVTDPDYGNRSQVQASIDTLVESYNAYLEDLDTMQSTTGTSPTSFVPHGPSLQQVAQLVSFAVSSLQTVASNARQERTIYLPEDSNWISIAEQYFGLQKDDSTIDECRALNNATLDEALIVAKGRLITYYV